MNVKIYPEAPGAPVRPRHVNGVLVIPGVPRHVRTRFSAAQLNAGATLLPALLGFKYRMIDAAAIAIGGNAATSTGIDVLGTGAGSSRKIASYKVAGLTQSTYLRAGTATNGIILADGASHTANDVNTPVTVITDGGGLTGATSVDILLTYVVE